MAGFPDCPPAKGFGVWVWVMVIICLVKLLYVDLAKVSFNLRLLSYKGFRPVCGGCLVTLLSFSISILTKRWFAFDVIEQYHLRSFSGRYSSVHSLLFIL